mmetsp:Transcript_10894/g.15619  ORF Transcript_10894/g.15619 Transcript_10894/m.15619 type:complete len:440 (-) Transcript_10894:80-1399(-)
MAKALWLGAVAALVCMGHDANAFHTVVPFLGKGKGQISSQSFLSSTRVLRVGGTKMTIDDKSSKFEEIKETDRKQKEVEAKEAARALEIRLEERDERLKNSQEQSGKTSSWDPAITGVPDVRKGIDAAEVAKHLATIAAQGGPPGGKAPTKIFKALKKNSGSIAVGVEYKRDEQAQDVVDSGDLRVFSSTLRKNKVDVLLVDCSTPSGVSDCEGIIKEQASARMVFPGPLPVIRTGSKASLNTIAEAKALGCEGILISYLNNVNENADELVKACISVALEPIAMVNSKLHVDAALAAGAKIFCMEPTLPSSIFCDDAKTASKFSNALRASIPADCVAVGGLDSHIGGPPLKVLEEPTEKKKADDGTIAEAWSPKVLQFAAELRAIAPDKGGLSAIFAFNVAQSPSVRVERNFCLWLVENLLSKKSSKFSVPTGNNFETR